MLWKMGNLTIIRISPESVSIVIQSRQRGHIPSHIGVKPKMKARAELCQKVMQCLLTAIQVSCHIWQDYFIGELLSIIKYRKINLRSRSTYVEISTACDLNDNDIGKVRSSVCPRSYVDLLSCACFNFFFSALSYLTTKTLGAVVGNIGPLFILDNRMMMFLDQNCLLFHVITAVSSDIDDMVFKKLFKDCIDVYCIVGHITC